MGAKGLFIGTAGWTVGKDAGPAFDGAGTHLQRYARGLTGAEINSTFYRAHMPRTFARWAASVPPGFRFACKAPKAITHEAKLRNAGAALAAFVEQVSALGEALGPLLFQLPPKLEFDAGVAEEFLATLRELHTGPVALEPRNATWFTAEAAALLRRHEVARVAADPARVPEAARPGGWAGLRYWRLHGSPRTYYSAYDEGYVSEMAAQVNSAAARAEVWCVFDNTASGAAIHNARAVAELAQGPNGDWQMREGARKRKSSFPAGMTTKRRTPAAARAGLGCGHKQTTANTEVLALPE